MNFIRLKMIMLIIAFAFIVGTIMLIQVRFAHAQHRTSELPPVGPLIGWNVTPNHNIEARHYFGDGIIVITRRHKQPYGSSPECQQYRDDGETIYYSTDRIIYPAFRKPLQWSIEDFMGRICEAYDYEKLKCRKWK